MWSQEARDKAVEHKRSVSRHKRLIDLEVIPKETAMSWQDIQRQLQKAGFNVRPMFIAGVPASQPTTIISAGKTWYLFAIQE